MPQKFSMHLTVDSDPHSESWLGYLGPGLAVFAVPCVTYQDLWNKQLAEPYSSNRLFAAFLDAATSRFDGARGNLELEVLKSRVIDAARDAFARFPDASEAGIGAMKLTLVAAPRGCNSLGLVHIGPAVSLKVDSAAGVSLVVKPHSPLYGPDPLGEEVASMAANVSTAVLEPRMRQADELRAARVELQRNEWLVVAPGSSAVKNLVLEAPPTSISEVEREVIGRLAAPYGAYPKSYLAISRRFT